MFVRHVDKLKDRTAEVIRMIAIACLFIGVMFPTHSLGGVREPSKPVFIPQTQDLFKAGLTAADPVAESNFAADADQTEPADQSPATLTLTEVAEVSSTRPAHDAECADEAEAAPILIPAAPAAFTAGMTMLLVVGLLTSRKLRYRIFSR